MFRRSRSGSTRTRRARTPRPSFLRSRKPLFEQLEDRQLLAVFTVINTNNAGVGSLRQAIIDSNTSVGVIDEIRFNIAAAGVQTIQPTSELDAITDAVFINGYSEPGATQNNFTGTLNTVLTIQLDGQNAGAGADGLQINSGGSGSIIRGLAINRFNANGILINGADNVTVAGNFIGTDVLGTVDLGNGGDGVRIEGDADTNTIGGANPADRNLISGNNSDGVEINGALASGNTVRFNLIGLNAAAAADLGNTANGVLLSGGTVNNTIGGTSNLTSRNIISGNDNAGVRLAGDGTDANAIIGNYIGTDHTGNNSVGNVDGVQVSSAAADNFIGGVTAAHANTISGNSDDGVEVEGVGTTGNLIRGNFIGSDFAGVLAIPNGGEGVEIGGGAANNSVGGTAAGSGNFIAFNTRNGVTVETAGSTGNRIQRNSIRNNVLLGIDLGDNGVTPNDAGDPDAGPNLLQNFPQFIGNATLLGDSIAIRYFVDSVSGANATYPLTIEFFIADSTNQEGRTFLASDTYAVGSAQQEKQITIPAPAVLTNTRIVATATDANGNTSEFSAALVIAPPRFLGSQPTVILPSEDIGQDQVDFFQYIAHSTGKLVVRIDFFHLFGDLALEVRDQFGNLLAMSNSSTADQNFEEVILPVVTQEKYFISVIAVDFEDDQTNFYALEVENFPTPVPTGVHLDPASDTGMMNNDNVTSDTTPTFFIQTDVLEFVDENNNGIADVTEINVLTAAEAAAGLTEGIAVEITLVNTTTGTSITGFADPLIATIPEVYVFTSGELQPGVYLVTARTKIFDGQEDAAGNPDPAMARSTASPPLWVTISADSPTGGTFDLLPTSDSGMFIDDEVTNKMQPAFAGQGPANAKVNVFAQAFDVNGNPVGGPVLVGNGVVGSDGTDGIPINGLGLWEVTVEPMIDGKYNFFARFETAAGIVGDPVAIGLNFANNTVIPIPDNGTANSQVNIPAGAATIVDLNVTINITHPNVEDLDIFLIAPDGTEIELSTDNGNGGANYTNTIFDDAAGISITAGVAPFTGTFRPEEMLSQLIGDPIGGTWTLRVTDDSGNEQLGTINSWALNFQLPLMVVIDTVEPNTPYLDLLDDTGRSNVDNITKDNTPRVSMTTTDPNIAFSQLLFTDNLKFRVYDRFNSTAEFLLYDSALDAAVDAIMTPGDMFTALTFIIETLPEQFFAINGGAAVPAVITVDGAGVLADGVHNLKLEVEDRAGNISHDFLLSIIVDTTTPPVSFGLPDGASQIDGLAASSDTGVTTMPMTYADRITSDTTPLVWGRAEADTIVRVYLDRDYDGIIDLNTDTFLGLTVALPYDGNDAYPDGYWELTSALDLNEILGLPKDGLRRLLVTAEDVAGNPMPMFDANENQIIANGVDELQIFIDTQGPQITAVTHPDYPDYDLFDPKPSVNGYTPLINSLTIDFRDLPSRVDQANALNDFLYEALKGDIAGAFGNYLLVGDHVGVIAIQSIVVNNESAADYTFDGTLTLVTSTSVITDANLVGAAEQPVVGDYILINNGAATGQVRRIVAYNSGTGQMTLDVPLLNLPAAGNSYTITTFAEATVTLNFASPLPDDRYTFTISDNIVDPAGNRLDGESNADEPTDTPTFPSGDGVPGGSFVARFTVDSRPEIGSYVSQNINIDINGNFIWDPASSQIGDDSTNVDISWTLPVQNANGTIGLGGFNVHDLLFAGKFRPLNNNGGGPAVAAIIGPRYFDQLAAYGNSAQEGGIFRWIIDTNSDGVVTLGTDIRTVQPALGNFNIAGALPVAGNFDGNLNNGDEVGLYYSGKWGLDFNRNFVIEANEVISTNLFGRPIVGDFDGDGLDDLAVFNNNVFSFNLAFDGFNDANDRSLTWGFPGVLDQPVAADMDQDGIDDIGLWVPRNSATPPGQLSQWYFLISNDPTGNLRTTGTVNRLNHAFTPVPFGSDLYAEFGDDRAMPILGNFDPPVTKALPSQSNQLSGDYNGNGRVDQADYGVWKSSFGSRTNLVADGNGNGVVDAGDYTIWRSNLGAVAAAATGAAAVAVQGDFDGNGQVTAADYTVWKTSFGSTTNLSGDANGDGRVDAADYTSWRDNLGTSSGSGSGGAALATADETGGGASESLLVLQLAASIGFEPVSLTLDEASAAADGEASLLLAISAGPATRIDDALEEFGVDSWTESDEEDDADELALAAAWDTWGEF